MCVLHALIHRVCCTQCTRVFIALCIFSVCFVWLWLPLKPFKYFSFHLNLNSIEMIVCVRACLVAVVFVLVSFLLLLFACAAQVLCGGCCALS